MAQAEEDVLSFQTLTRGVAGICEGAADDEYVATVQKDGVTIRTTVVKEIGTTWPLGVSLGAEQLQFLTPAVHCAEADAYAAVVAPSATSAGGAAHNGAAAAGNGVAAAANELWMWTSASSHSTLIRNATRHQLPRGTVVGLHPVGPATTYVDPGPVEAARLRGARATSMAKASGTLGNDSLNLPSPEAAAADARPSVGAAPGALGFALVFADASLVHIAAPSATRTMDQAVVVTQLPAPEAAGRLVLASAHSGSALVVIVAEPKSASTAVCLYTAETSSEKEQPLRREVLKVAAPEEDAVVRRAAVRGDRLALLWSTGALTACRLSALRGTTLAAAPALGHTHISLLLKGFALGPAVALQQAASPAPGTANKRRKAATKGLTAAAAPSMGGVVDALGTAAVSPEIVLLPHDHAAIVGWQSNDGTVAAAGGRLRVAVVELKYGSARSVASAPCGEGAVHQRLHALALGADTLVVLAGTAVLAASVQVAPVTLASVVGSLAIDCRFQAADDTPQKHAARLLFQPQGLSSQMPVPDYRAVERDIAKAKDTPAAEGDICVRVPLSEPSSDADAASAPDPTAKLLSAMAVDGASTPSLEQAVAAVAAAARRAQEVHLDAVGQAAVVCADRGHWDAVSAFLQSGLLCSAQVAPALVSRMAAAGQLRLCAELLNKGGELTTLELRRLLDMTLPGYSAATSSQPAALKRAQQALHTQLLAAAEAAVTAAEKDRGRRSLYVAAALAAVIEPFPAHELLLHPLVASETTATVVAEAAQHLDARQALALLRYLAGWLTHHSQLLAGWLHPVGRQRRGRPSAPRPQRGAATDTRGRDGQRRSGHGRSRSRSRSGGGQSAQQATACSDGSGGSRQSAAQLASLPQPAAAEAQPPLEADVAAADMDTGAEDAAAAARPNGRSGGSGEGGSRRGALWWPVPPLERVTAWATAVLGAHLVTLQPNEATQQVLDEMRVAVGSQLAEVAAAVRVRGAVDHLRSEKQLPAGQDAASLYTVEHVDLSLL